jgi:hypothetical protein
MKSRREGSGVQYWYRPPVRAIVLYVFDAVRVTEPCRVPPSAPSYRAWSASRDAGEPARDPVKVPSPTRQLARHNGFLRSFTHSVLNVCGRKVWRATQDQLEVPSRRRDVLRWQWAETTIAGEPGGHCANTKHSPCTRHNRRNDMPGYETQQIGDATEISTAPERVQAP